MDLTEALAPNSDQLDFVDLEGRGPIVFTITKVSENKSELAKKQKQYVNVTLEEFPRVWRPSKGMVKVMADNWGKDVKEWVGRKVELYGDPDVYLGNEKRGGTRISRLSHIPAKKTTLVNPRGGKDAYWSVAPLPDAPQAQPATPEPIEVRIPKAVEWFAGKGVELSALEAHVRSSIDEWAPADLDDLMAARDELVELNAQAPEQGEVSA